VFRQQDACQKALRNRQAKDLAQVRDASRLNEGARGGDPDFGIVILERLLEQIAGDPAARLVGAHKGKTSVGLAANRLDLGAGILAPVVHQRQFEREIAQAVARAAADGAMKLEEGVDEFVAVVFGEYPD